MDKILGKQYAPKKDDFESGKLEAIKVELSQDDEKKLEALMKTNHFESSEAAQEFLRSLDFSIEKLKAIDGDVENFSISFEKIIQEAQEQIAEIEKLGGEIDAEEKSRMFGDILKGFYESGEYKSIGNEDDEKPNVPKVINLAKKFGNFVRSNKTAFIALGVFSLFSKLGTGTAEASETNYDLSSAQLNEFQASLEGFDLIGDGTEVPINEIMDHNPSEEFRDLAEQIKSAENDDEAIFHSTVVDNDKIEGVHSPEVESMENEAKQKISELIEKIKEGPQRINVKNYNLFSVQETSDFDEGKTAIDDYSKSLTAISQMESISEEEFKLTKEVQISSIGSSPENAVMQAMEEAASFININVSSESNLSEHSADQESGETFSKRIETSTNENITVTNIEISDYQHDGEKLYEAKITIN